MPRPAKIKRVQNIAVVSMDSSETVVEKRPIQRELTEDEKLEIAKRTLVEIESERESDSDVEFPIIHQNNLVNEVHEVNEVNEVDEFFNSAAEEKKEQKEEKKEAKKFDEIDALFAQIKEPEQQKSVHKEYKVIKHVKEWRVIDPVSGEFTRYPFSKYPTLESLPSL